MMMAMRRSVEPRWWTLVAVCGATFILLVDVTIVQVALPTIQRRLGAGFADLQWVIDGYALTLATLILTWGSWPIVSGANACSSRPAVFTWPHSSVDWRGARLSSSPRAPLRVSAAQPCSPQGWP